MRPTTIAKIIQGIEEEHFGESAGQQPVIMSIEDFQKHMDAEMEFQEGINKISNERPWDVCWTQSQRPQ